MLAKVLYHLWYKGYMIIRLEYHIGSGFGKKKGPNKNITERDKKASKSGFRVKITPSGKISEK